MKALDRCELDRHANNCLMCKKPRCRMNCPIDTPIPEVIELFKQERLEEAGEMLFNNNPLSAICGIVCPHAEQCYGNCIKGIKGEAVKFCDIESFVSYEYLKNSKFTRTNHLDDRIAIIGSGPAGIALAFMLAKKGYKITIFEKNSRLGGVLRYGIPEFRLSRGILDSLEERLLDLDIKIRYNALIGPVITIDKLFEDGYKAIFIGTGVWNPKTLRIKGETLGHVHYAINYLKSPKSFRLGKKVIVVGAGNVAMDAARTAKRNGADEVVVVYRKDFDDMSATRAEIDEALEDGVQFELYKTPVEIVEEGMIFGDTKEIIDEDGNCQLIPVENTETLIEADSIIIAISQDPQDNIVANTENIHTNKHGLLVTNEVGRTTREGIFASGDVVTGARTVVEAVANTKKVAEAIDHYCQLKR